jgi:F-type H+-transporting ATPase subunit b
MRPPAIGAGGSDSEGLVMFVTNAYAQEGAATGAATTHTSTEAGHGSEVFPPFDPSNFPSQLLWLAITFGLFYLFLKRAALPRIGNILEVRRDRIAQDLDQAGRMKDEADAAVAAYEQELAEARRRANAIGQESRDKAKVEAEAERRRVEGKLNSDLAAAEDRIASIKQTAMKDVDQIASETATAIVQQLLGSRVDGKAVAAAVSSVAR